MVTMLDTLESPNLAPPVPLESDRTTIGNAVYEGYWAASGTLEIVVDAARIAANPINYTDPRGLDVEVPNGVDYRPGEISVNGPDVKTVSWIKGKITAADWVFDRPALEESLRSYADAIGNTTNIDWKAMQKAWSKSYEGLSYLPNPDPPLSFTSASWNGFVDSKEYRGWLDLKVRLVNDRPVVSVDSSPGYTPFPTGFKLGEGDVKIAQEKKDNYWVITALEYSRIGKEGQFDTRGMLGVEAPWRWVEIKYEIGCGITPHVKISFSVSDFPSTYAYINGTKMGFSPQTNLPQFIYSNPNNNLAEGGQFADWKSSW